MTRRATQLLLATLLCCGAAPPRNAAPPASRLLIPAIMPGDKGAPPVALTCIAPIERPIPVRAIAFAPDGKTLAAGGYQEAALWDLATGRLLRRVGVGSLNGVVNALAFARNGTLLAVGEGLAGTHGDVRLLDTATGKGCGGFDGPTDMVDALAFSPDEKLLAVGSMDGQIYIWSVDDHKLVSTLKGHTGWVLSVAFSADGKLLASASSDKTVRIWQADGWKPVITITVGDGARGAAFSPSGQQVAVAVGGEQERTVTIRNARSGGTLRDLGMGMTQPLGLTWDAKSGKLFVPSVDGLFRTIDGTGSYNVQALTLAGHPDLAYCAALAPDRTRLAVGSPDGTVKLWSLPDGKPIATLALLAPHADGWLIVTADGYVSASSLAALTWRLGSSPVAPALAKRLLVPDAVRQALSGKPYPPPDLKRVTEKAK